ncbi:MAG: polysaccharide deacetylase [Pararhodobacter sp.]|nr:polysaccharide deacetylase [Pararhodobacter sp.]
MWPNNAKCAVMLTFDFDAETLWLSRDPANARKPGVLSKGIYGARRGVPEILKLLREYKLPSTFFVPGWTAEKYPDRIHAILEDGHEIGHHSYLHEWIDPDKPLEERESFERALEALDKVAGIKPVGYRSPAGETSPTLMGLLNEHGLLYDSSLMTDVVPYRHTLDDGTPGPVELPWHWSTDDAPFMMFAIQAPRPMFTNDHVFQIWRDEFDAVYEWGGLFNLVMHPQFTGRPSRTLLLRRMIEHILSKPDAWIATGEDVARAWMKHEAANG